MQATPAWIRFWFVTLAALGGAFWAREGRAWIEKRVSSSTTHIEIAADGSAIVRHQLTLTVRGSPLGSFTLKGIDADASLFSDATLTRMSNGAATSLPLPVRVQQSDGVLEMKVPLKRGFRGRTFRFEFGYRSDFLGRGLIRRGRAEEPAKLAWIGPRFDDGVDAVTLVVRTRAAGRAPELATEDGVAPEDLGNYGIVMSTLRRSQQRDELELVRAHIARDEAMTWRVALDPQLFPEQPTAGALNRAPLTPAALAPELRALPHAARGTSELQLSWAGIAGIIYAALVALKRWSFRRAAQARRCRARALVIDGTLLGALAAGSFSFGAIALAFRDVSPLGPSLCLLGAMAFAAERSPQPEWVLRGPGQFRPLGPGGFAALPLSRGHLPGAYLDAGRWLGCALLVLALSVNVWLAARVFAFSPYYGACLLLAGSALLPLFCSGRAAELPRDLLWESRRFLSRLEARLAKDRELVLQPLGRFTAAANELDELRLGVVSGRGVPGLLGLELGLEQEVTLHGIRTAPVLVVRAADGSPAQRALPRDLTWTRGRSENERAALVRPKLADVESACALLYELLELLPGKASAPAPAASKARKSSGKGLSTAKAGTRSSPAHAT